MAADEPPYLNVGTDVSAKYKGAFCEAKIKKVNRIVKCKVTFKNNLGSAMIPDEQIKGSLRIGAEVEARHPEKNQYCEAVINKLQDYSQYTVVFDDGDETTLRRTSLCLKSGRHFAESPTLDQFPLTNPEHFGTPVIGAGKSKRKRRSTMNSASVDYESSDEELIPRKVKNVRGKDRDPDLGKVVCVDFGDRRKKDNWYPGLVVSNPVQSNIKISRDEYLIRSFKDGKYYQVPKRDTREFTKDCIQKVENNSLKIAVEKAILYYEKEELPPHWDKALFMGLDLPIDEESHDSESDTSDDEPSEEKDRFVAQLYKFMDERGTPINKAPTVGNRDLNLYKLFKIMHKMGGYNKVTNQNKWKMVYIKMELPSSNSAGSNQIKVAYKRYLHSFEDFYRKLGCTMQTNSRTRGGRHRSDRNIIITRTRDRDASSSSSSKGKSSIKESKDKVPLDKKSEDKTRHSEKREGKAEEKSDEKLRTPEKKKSERLQPDDKDKLKKDDKPRLIRSHSLNKDKKESGSKEDTKKESKPEKARTREDARKEKNESPEKKGTRSSLKIEQERKEKEENEKKDSVKDKKEKTVKDKEKKEEKSTKDAKEEKSKDKKDDKVKEKKDDKIIKEKRSEKLVKDKKPDEKVMKDKDKVIREKKEDKPKDKKEPLKSDEREIKCKIEEKLMEKVTVDDKLSLKSKKDRFVKDKKEEKIFRSRREDKSPASESEKKGDDSNSSKSMKDDNVEKAPKDQVEVKKEDPSMKDRPKCKFLREKGEGSSLAEDSDEEYILEFDDSEMKGGPSQESDNDSFYKRGPGSRSGLDDDFPAKSKRRAFKSDDREDKESLLGMSDSDDESFLNDCDRGDMKGLKQGEIEIGDRVKVKYGRGRMQKVYEAKVLKIDTSGAEKRYYVHYAGWNMRYDEWVRKSYIVANMSECNRFARKQKLEMSNAPTSSSPVPATTSVKKIDRSRPPGAFLNAKPIRKNSTSSNNSSVSCPRTTRSDKKSLQTSPFTSGLKPRRRMRKKSGISTGLTDTSQDSYSDGEDAPMDLDDDLEDDGQDNQDQNDNSFKEELFSDDEEKEKQEEVKREDITELEKAISVEDTSDIKELIINKLMDVDVCGSKPGEVKLLCDLEKEEEAKNLLSKTSAKPSSEEKCEIRLKSENVLFTKKPVASMIEGKFEKKFQSYDQQPTRIVTPSVSIDTFSSLYKANSAFTPVAEKKDEKLLVAKTTSTANSSSPEFPFKRSYLPVVPSPTLERNLSFAGLIQKTAFEKISHPEATGQKERFSKIGSCVSSTLQTIKPSVPEKDVKSFDLSKYKQPTLIVEAKTMLKSETVLKPIPKEMPSFKDTIKPAICTPKVTSVVMEQKIDNKPELIVASPKVVPGLNKVLADKKEVICEGIFKSKQIPSSSPLLVKPIPSVPQPLGRVLMSIQTAVEMKKENPPKDSFDLLLKSSSMSTQEHGKAEVKSMFPITFTSHPVIKEKHISEPLPHAKPVSILSEGLSGIGTSIEGRVKTKPTETVDLSKAIPGILERLKKDVVAETKFSDSPPPQREELSFDFLCGSHEATKSLSHSDSSNSLRICEDMSDTNDSNNDSRELPISKKIEPLSHGVRILDQFIVRGTEMKGSSATDVRTNVAQSEGQKLSEVKERLSVESKKLVVENKMMPVENKKQEKLSLTVDAPVKDNAPVKDVKSQAQKTSVITAAASAALSVVSAVSLPESNENLAMTKDNFPVALDPPKPASSTSSKSFIDSGSSSSSPMPSERKRDLEEFNKEINSEISKHTDVGKVVSNVSQESKDALFDDLLKIKSTTTHFPQGSVIKRVPDSEKVVPQNIALKETSSISEVTKNVTEEKANDAIKVVQKELVVLDKEVAPVKELHEEKDAFDKLKDDCSNRFSMSSKKDEEDAILPEDDSSTSTTIKKEGKKKKSKLAKLDKHRSSSDGLDKDDSRDGKSKEGKGKSKKRVRLESDDQEKGKMKKVKKNKSKKRFAKHDEQFSEYLKKLELKEDESKDSLLEKGKKKDKRKMDKKYIKGGTKSDEGADAKGEGPKKKKGKKNRDKFGNEKKDLGEKKLKKKKKLHMDDNLDSDSDSVHKVMDKKKKKERKKFKAKDGSSSDEGHEDKMYKQQGKDLTDPLPRQDSKSDDPDMSFLFCEEKVPASPVDDSSGSLSNEENNSNIQPNVEPQQMPVMNRYQRVDNMGPLNPMNKHSIDTCAVLDNTPPTTPSSTESLLSSSPSHDRDAFSLNYPESTQSGRESGEGEPDVFHCNNSNRTVMTESEEYRAATTLAFAVGKSVNDNPKDITHSFLKRQKSEMEEHSPSKRKKKSKRMRHSSESAKSPRHKSSLSRLPKDESGCEDSSGTSPTTSNSPPYGTSTISTSFSRSSHSLSSITDSTSRYSFCAPLQDKDPEKRIAILQDKMTQLRKEYMALKAEVAMIDRRRKKARKKVRDTAGSVATNPSVQSEDGQSCS